MEGTYSILFHFLYSILTYDSFNIQYGAFMQLTNPILSMMYILYIIDHFEGFKIIFSGNVDLNKHNFNNNSIGLGAPSRKP